ncbi:hypothetical protein CF165_26905 [Amycolatopsis vastitatis]|uniref:Glucose/Sorbosone dehydrogenase domain-containing protein n=1 Tax=Amycolatopsis vastitatis TaxID=1905142 RepID=A0A229SYZ4_9PSEU|nr:hypothetical protein CF165_26905 [Amycolatopsis vastitatis]
MLRPGVVQPPVIDSTSRRGRSAFVCTRQGDLSGLKSASTYQGEVIRFKQTPMPHLTSCQPISEVLAVEEQGRLWEQEFGNSIMDETGLITKGGNYCWPACEGPSGTCGTARFIAPKRTTSVPSTSFRRT